MALFHGKHGKVYWDSQGDDTNLEHCIDFSIDAVADVAEATAMQADWKSYKGGFKDWTATVTCLLDSAGLDVPLATNSIEALGENTPAKLELFVEWDNVTPHYTALYGSAICTGVSIAQDKDDIVKVTYTFQGTDTLAWWSDTTEPTYA